MRIRIFCLLLVLVLALPMLASCNREQALDDKVAAVYTLYCITEESTTPEAITRVEYEINRILFYRIGSIVKLEMVTADEYEELIESKMEEIKAYKETPKDDASQTTSGNKKNTNTLVNTAKLSESAKNAGYTAMSGEAILNDLAAGIEIELECPRLDLFLVTDYDSYVKLAEDGKLAALDTVLNNEAKAIKSYVHSSFFNAAKVGNKTYGVPCNSIIGEYTYIVFNEQVLNDSGVARETLYTLEDLSEFLAIVKEQHPEVIPLANTVSPSALYYMFEDGFPAYVNQNGYVLSTYEDATVNNYLTMLTRYSALGYFENDEHVTGETADEDTPFAVKFISSTKQEMDALAEEKGYVYNRYSVPIATNENTIDSIYCLAGTDYCPSSWQTDAMEVLTELYTDENLQNLFLYGVENENYRLENNNQVVYRINDEYMMNPAHTGNCFIAHIDGDAGDPLTKWTDARDQNIDAIDSKTIGFTFEPKKYTFIKRNSEGQMEEVTVVEPDYEAILWKIIEPYYKKLTNGTAIQFDYNSIYEEADAAARESIRVELLSTYEKRLQLKYTGDLAQQVSELYEEEFSVGAEALAKEQLVSDFDTNSRRRKLTNQLKDENPDADDDEIDRILEALLKDPDRLWEGYRTIVRSEAQWDDIIEEYYEELFDDKLKEETDRVLNSDEYLAELNAIPETEAFIEDYTYALEVQVVDTVKQNLDDMIAELIKEYCAEMIKECEETLDKEINAFAAKYAAATKDALEATVRQQAELRYKSEQLTPEQLDERTKDILEFLKTNAALAEDKTNDAIRTLLKGYYGELDTVELNKYFDPWKKDYDSIYLPAYSKAFNGTNQALFDIGFLKKDALTFFGTAPEEEEEEEEEPTEPEVPSDPPEDGEDGIPFAAYDSYYHFVFNVKLKGAYYALFGEPGK
ncbi:MAG: hypothetical protein J1E00_05015 [Oscillospiraceae bacterium]|nr:hypothetical protein [Oscillospiraceae bacterium]